MKTNEMLYMHVLSIEDNLQLIAQITREGILTVTIVTATESYCKQDTSNVCRFIYVNCVRIM